MDSSSSLSPCSSDAAAAAAVVSKCRVYPSRKSTMPDLQLSVSDLPMLSCHYIQKGVLLTRPPFPTQSLLSLLKSSLSNTLSLFPPLAGRLSTDPSSGRIYLVSDDTGVEFLHAVAPSHLLIRHVIAPASCRRVPDFIKSFFPFHRTVAYEGHHRPILAVQVTELGDGIFIGCAANHSVVDGTSFWNFFNTFAEVCRAGERRISSVSDFRRESVLISDAILRVPEGGPKVTFNADEPVSERIFSFSREAILKLKARANNRNWPESDGDFTVVELMGKQRNDPYANKVNGSGSGRVTASSFLENWFKSSSKNNVRPRGGATVAPKTAEISSFQALSALLWRSVTRARKLHVSKTTTFRMAINCRHRLEPKLDPYYFGNAIQSIPTRAPAGELLSRDLKWCAEQLNKSVMAHGDAAVRGMVEQWEREPRCFPLGNPDGACISMGSSPRFPMYDNDFGWGRPAAIRSGGANKFDGKISAFPGREGSGSVDLEVVLKPETMALVECDEEFMQYVSE